jgi:negative regulator of flagellin synthesis FlgM
MSEIINLGSVNFPIAPAYPAANRLALRETGQAETSSVTDSVEISRLGRTMSRIMNDSSLRLARINALRAQIADGTFETPERINGTVDRLLDVVG